MQKAFTPRTAASPAGPGLVHKVEDLGKAGDSDSIKKASAM